MPWKPSEPGEFPTLGWYAIDWIEGNLARPDRQDYEPMRLSREQAEFLLDFYRLDPATCRRVVRRGVLSRPRGWGKSPFMGAVGLLEALGDVVPDGWDADGQPVGRPWATERRVTVTVAAVTEDQTRFAWLPLLEMAQGPVLDAYPGLEPLEGFVNLPGPRGSRISPITASPKSIKGEPTVFALLDQTEMWTPSNGGVKLAMIMLDNAAKTGGSVIETPNAYTPGDGSVAENTANAQRAMAEGRTRRDEGILWDHREAPPETDMSDEASLVAGLRYAYGDSSAHPGGCTIHEPPCPPGWADIGDRVARVYDPDYDPQDAAGNFLNQITHAADAWLSSPEWAARKGADHGVRPVADRDIVVLGFDGSRGRVRGKPDATALVGVRVEDGYVFQLGVWEAGDRIAEWPKWSPPIPLIEAEIADAFRRFQVVGFYCDPGRDWRSHVNAWEARWGSQVKVKGTRDHPFEWWMTGGRTGLVQRAVEQLEGAVRNGDMTHDGSARLTAHVLAARRRVRAGKLSLAKESDYSVHKIDAAVAAVLAWQARLDALAAGVTQQPTSTIFGRLY